MSHLRAHFPNFSLRISGFASSFLHILCIPNFRTSSSLGLCSAGSQPVCSRGEREGDCSTPSPIGPMFRPLAGSQIKGMGVGRVEREVGSVKRGVGRVEREVVSVKRGVGRKQSWGIVIFLSRHVNLLTLHRDVFFFNIFPPCLAASLHASPSFKRVFKKKLAS